MNGRRLSLALVRKQVGRIEMDELTLKLAVLIDADNAQPSIIEELLAEIARFGEPTVKRIYGDFTAPTSSQWKKVLNRFAIKPMQQFAYTTGKNATDSTLIIDAMDLLYTRRFDGFCLVSSDSDFTGLALRIREEGLTVYGFGEQKTPEAFRNACHKFILTELLRPISGMPEVKQPPAEISATNAPKPTAQAEDKARDVFPIEFFKEALEKASDDSGWADLGNFGNYLTKLRPDFDPRSFGYKKLSDLIKARTDIFNIEERKAGESGNAVIYISVKRPCGA
jgi:uncharacterized LabA/DUF88 family protein